MERLFLYFGRRVNLKEDCNNRWSQGLGSYLCMMNLEAVLPLKRCKDWTGLGSWQEMSGLLKKRRNRKMYQSKKKLSYR